MPVLPLCARLRRSTPISMRCEERPMKRRQFLGYTGVSAIGLATASVTTGCTQEPPVVKFWHEGNFRPVTDEVTVTDLKVEGSIPAELSGLYVRNGSNASSGVAEHFFGGDGMVHGVRIENGQAKWYRNRYYACRCQRQHAPGRAY